MQYKNIKIVALIILLGLALFFILKSTSHPAMMENGMHVMSDGTIMNSSGHSSMKVENDQEFIQGMIPHHQEAVDTAQEVLARGGSFPEIKTLAENIVSSQTTEIQEMKRWHEIWFDAPYVADTSYVPMMRDVTKLSGKELDKVFLEDMIVHHMGAIMMAGQALGFSKREEIITISNAILEAQDKEVKQMKGWLTTKF